MALTAKITQVQSNGTFGEFYCFEYTLDDGYSGLSYQRKNDSFGKPGDVIEYERTQDKNGKAKVKINKKVAGPSVNTDAQRTDAQIKNTKINEERLNLDRDKQPIIVRQTAFKAACEYYANRQSNHKELFDLCQMLTNYALTGNIPDFGDDGDVLPF